MKEFIEMEKARAMNVMNITEYIAHSVVIKSILQKTTGSISTASFDSGETLNEKRNPFDSFVQIIEGKAEIIIDGLSNFLETGQSIIIPAHISHSVRANEQFKMIVTVIKCGYE